MSQRIESKTIEKLEDRIATLAASLYAITYELLECIREFDALGGWQEAGFRSCAHWLSWRIGIDLGAAREKIRVAKALGELPKVSEALRAGKLSYSKARAMTRVATPQNEPMLLEIAEYGTASQMEQLVRRYRAGRREQEAQRTQAQHVNRSLRTYYDDDGMLVIEGRLPPEEGALFMKALEVAKQDLWRESRRESHDVSAETSGNSQGANKQADALVRVAEQALQSSSDHAPSNERYLVAVHVDAEVLADPEADGRSEAGRTDVSAETSRRLSCDARILGMSHDKDGSILDVGRQKRVVSAPLRRALRHRDQGCRFPGCTNQHVDAHHLKHWANGGETSMDNLISLCRSHHRLVHEGGFSLEVRDNQVVAGAPDGRALCEVPGCSLTSKSLTEIQEELAMQGVRPSADSIYARWSGEVMDYGMGVMALEELEVA